MTTVGIKGLKSSPSPGMTQDSLVCYSSQLTELLWLHIWRC